MKFAYALGVTALVLAIAGWSLAELSLRQARAIEQRFPAIGKFAGIEGAKLHYLEVEAGAGADLAPMLFLHGASGNARDLYGAFAGPLAGRARMIFVDRPGAGYSQRAGAGDAQIEAQARRLAGLLEHLGIERAVIVGHSLGSAVALAMAVEEPDRVAGLMLISPVSHPWPGKSISWYYWLTNLPAVGPAFARFIAVPAGNFRYAAAVRSVFDPDPVTNDYESRSGTRLVLRPENFLANALDVGNAYAGVERLSPRYRDLAIPVTVVTGDRDSTVRADIHSHGLARDIAGVSLVVLEKTGHMPTYTATGRIVAEIEALNRRIGPAD